MYSICKFDEMLGVHVLRRNHLMGVAILILFVLIACVRQADPNPAVSSIYTPDYLSPYPIIMGCGIEIEDEDIVLNSGDVDYVVYAQDAISELNQTIDSSAAENTESAKAFLEHLKDCLSEIEN